MTRDRMTTWVWVLSGILLLAVTIQPVGTAAQMSTGVTLLAAMAGIWLTRRKGAFRLVFVALGLTVVARYVYWRTTSTLPSPDDLVDFVPGLILYLMEMFTVLMMCISLFVVADPLERPAPPAVADDDLPTVDVFVPSYNEDKEILSATLAAARAMDYPADKLTVYLLDDGGTDQKCGSSDAVAAHKARSRRAELQELCADLGCVYLTRVRNEHAKAGNMNAALPKTSGEIIAVFDADHAPVREFLRETVGHFRDDPRLFLVQTPHFFLNPDPIEKNLSTFRHMPSENEMFYGVIQKGLDKWNAAFFCGSAALIRREALEEGGGFDGVSITEDCETALGMHARGWNSRYVDKPLIAGLQPETFATFIGQRSRWCRGMMQILILKNPVFKAGLTIPQRIAYLSSSLFWLFPLTRLTFIFAPMLYIFLSMQIFEASIDEFVAYTMIYMAANLMMQNYLYGDVRWPWVSELYEYVQSLYLAGAIASVVANPRKPTFNVTAKGLVTDEKRLSELAMPYFLMFALLVVAETVAIWRLLHEPGSRDMLAVVALWNGLNLAIAGLALGVVSEREERRRAQRLSVSRRGAVRIGDATIQVMVEDVSSGGAKLRPLDGRLPADRSTGRKGFLAVAMSHEDRRVAAVPIVLRRVGHDEKGGAFGVSFDTLTAAQAAVVADLMYADGGPLSAFRRSRQHYVGVFSGTARMVALSLRHTLRGLVYLARIGQPPAEKPEPAPAAKPAEGAQRSQT
ncbi:cellulose synthase catalytic subunit [UDP-forming] [Pleomorphomonas sp. SM30]|uniref:Cellulose synthase catalytic subunit [UDP-forming] n=2 Tax=Oharaeibacter diazotrophicus TaxID=1920512 RepID=A0A4R6R9L4_9HYPH|nr:cellulose synthase (UDP-forming) [Oharaeibacter diazotrophicus]BBE72477.1 cellulose synthase catalytic subunit [UDP-forming] [Pleomorphomonas sp. SM30]